MKKQQPTSATTDGIAGDKRTAGTSGGFWPLKLPFFGGGNHNERKGQDNSVATDSSCVLDERTHRGQPI